MSAPGTSVVIGFAVSTQSQPLIASKRGPYLSESESVRPSVKRLVIRNGHHLPPMLAHAGPSWVPMPVILDPPPPSCIGVIFGPLKETKGGRMGVLWSLAALELAQCAPFHVGAKPSPARRRCGATVLTG